MVVLLVRSVMTDNILDNLINLINLARSTTILAMENPLFDVEALHSLDKASQHLEASFVTLVLLRRGNDVSFQSSSLPEVDDTDR